LTTTSLKKADDLLPIAKAASEVAGTSAGSSPGLKSFAFSDKDRNYALAAREAGRLNAAAVPDEEVDALQEERQALLDKQFEETITPKERSRLTYVQWSLDRIEDARHGRTLDALERRVQTLERFGEDIDRLRDELNKIARRR
jgi:hypothetical protein